jgi:uncharacterized Tic20 family protein
MENSMSDAMESGGGAQPAPRPEPEDVPNYERSIDPEPPSPPSQPAGDAEATSFSPSEPTLESVARRLEDLHAAAFAEAAAPTESDLREVDQAADALSVEAEPVSLPVAEPTGLPKRGPKREKVAPGSNASSEQPMVGEDDERLFAALAHLSSLVVPLLGPVLIMLLNQNRSEWVDEQAKEALNFQINMLGWAVLLFAASFVLIGLCGIPVLALAGVVLPIVAAVQTLSGKRFRYPFIWRLLR